MSMELLYDDYKDGGLYNGDKQVENQDMSALIVGVAEK